MQHGADVVRKLRAAGWPKNVLINVNFPDCSPAGVKGITVTSQGQRDQGLLSIVDRMDTRGNPYYWFGFERRDYARPPGTDLRAMVDGFISVTPLHLDQTHEETARALMGKLGELATPKG